MEKSAIPSSVFICVLLSMAAILFGGAWYFEFVEEKEYGTIQMAIKEILSNK